MLETVDGTTTFPDPDSDAGGYTVDDAFFIAQDELWTSFFGGLVSWALFACAMIQFGYYFIHFRRDHAVVRGTVSLLLLIEIASTSFLTWTTYVTQVKMWGHEPSFAPQMWGNMLFDCTTASIVHAMYIWRISKLTERRSLARLMTIVIALLSITQFGCCVAASLYNALQDKESADKQDIARRLFHTWLACASTADIVITLVIASVLYCSRTGVHATDTLIKKVLLVTAPGGAITALIQLGILVVQLLATDTTKTTFLILILTKFYSNSVMLCFNLRAKLSGPLLDRSGGGGGSSADAKRYSYSPAHIHTVTTQGHSHDFGDVAHGRYSSDMRACPWMAAAAATTSSGASSTAAPAAAVFDRHRPTTLEGFLEAQPHGSLFTAAGGTLIDKLACGSSMSCSPPSNAKDADVTLAGTTAATHKVDEKTRDDVKDDCPDKRRTSYTQYTHDSSYSSSPSAMSSGSSSANCIKPKHGPRPLGNRF